MPSGLAPSEPNSPAPTPFPSQNHINSSENLSANGGNPVLTTGIVITTLSCTGLVAYYAYKYWQKKSQETAKSNLNSEDQIENAENAENAEKTPDSGLEYDEEAGSN